MSKADVSEGVALVIGVVVIFEGRFQLGVTVRRYVIFVNAHLFSTLTLPLLMGAVKIRHSVSIETARPDE